MKCELIIWKCCRAQIFLYSIDLFCRYNVWCKFILSLISKLVKSYDCFLWLFCFLECFNRNVFIIYLDKSKLRPEYSVVSRCLICQHWLIKFVCLPLCISIPLARMWKERIRELIKSEVLPSLIGISIADFWRMYQCKSYFIIFLFIPTIFAIVKYRHTKAIVRICNVSPPVSQKFAMSIGIIRIRTIWSAVGIHICSDA